MHYSGPRFEVAALSRWRTSTAAATMLDDPLLETRRGGRPRNRRGGKQQERNRTQCN